MRQWFDIEIDGRETRVFAELVTWQPAGPRRPTPGALVVLSAPKLAPIAGDGAFSGATVSGPNGVILMGRGVATYLPAETPSLSLQERDRE